MYFGKRTQKEVTIHGLHHRMGGSKTFKEFTGEINNKTYKLDAIGFAYFNEKGEALQLSISMSICDEDGKSLRKDGKVEITCKGHTIENQMKKSCFRKCCGLNSGTETYIETTGKMDFKKISNKFFDVKPIGEPKPYPIINAEITFSSGIIYYLRISWKKDYEFTMDLEGPTIYAR